MTVRARGILLLHPCERFQNVADVFRVQLVATHFQFAEGGYKRKRIEDLSTWRCWCRGEGLKERVHPEVDGNVEDLQVVHAPKEEAVKLIFRLAVQAQIQLLQHRAYDGA